MQGHCNELHPEVKAALPCPGDLIKAEKVMRAWRDIHARGLDGPWIRENQTVTVHSVWLVNSQCRLLVWFMGSMTLFSCKAIDVCKNWTTVSGRRLKVSPEALSRLTRGNPYLEQAGPSGDPPGPKIKPRRPWPIDPVGMDP